MTHSLSRRLSAAIVSRFRGNLEVARYSASASFCTKTLSSEESDLEPDTDAESPPHSAGGSSPDHQRRIGGDRPLENGLDIGIYKAILVGQLGQVPIKKRLKSGHTVTLVSLGTGGIRNNRRPLDDESPREYANRCAVQWHRVSIYQESLAELAAKNLVPGSMLYVEGNLETKIFNDPITGLVRRIREIAVRRNGRILLLSNGADQGADQFTREDVARVGYY